jgi:Domain of Unknown Function (DUF1080)
MWRYPAVLLALSVAASTPAHRTIPPSDALLGRWDITIHTPNGDRPSWLEIWSSGRDALVGQLVGVVGSARPIGHVEVSGDSLHFAIPHQWEAGEGELVVAGKVDGEKLSGSMTFPDGKSYDWTGERAPSLKHDKPPVWGTPIRLLHVNDFGGWKAIGGASDTNQWVVKNGLLQSPHSGRNVMTERTFNDFKLHIEFRYPKGSNSGVYLRGRYEVQIQDDYGLDPADDRFSGVYGFLAPSEITARPPGAWQIYDVTLVGRMVTVVANGKTVICNREIPGITGGALDSKEGTPGPLMLQGDHGPIEFRNIVLTPAK